MVISRAINTLTQQCRIVTNMAVGILITRIVIEYLGESIYANLGVMLSITAFVGTISNAFTGAAARYLTQSIAKNAIKEASVYLSNAVGGALIIGILIGGIAVFIQIIRPGTFGDIPLLVMIFFIIAVLANSISGIFRAINFATERLASSSLVFIVSKIMYAILAFYFVVYTSSGVIGLAFSSLIAGFLAFLFSFKLSKIIMPSIHLSISEISFVIFREIFIFVIWTLLIYCGLYLSGSGIQIVAKNIISDDAQLARLVLSFQIGTIAYSFLNSLSIITSPAIYKALAKHSYRKASRLMEHYFFLVTVASIFGTIFFLLEGENLISLWLGKYAPKNVMPVALGFIVSFSVSSLSVGLHVFLSGSNQIGHYGIITILEGISSILFVSMWLILSNYHDLDGIAYVGWILAFTTGIKIAYTIIKFNSVILLSPITAYLLKFVHIAILIIACLILYFIQNYFLFQTVSFLPLRLIIFSFPICTYFLIRFLNHNNFDNIL